MNGCVLGVIGGSGLYELAGLTDTRWVAVDTPWGAPSDEILLGRLGDAELAFLPRHGRGHRIPPGEVNYRANIAALKQLGATDVLSLSAVGGLREDLPPGTFVVVDQFVDRTTSRAGSFFGRGLVAHVSMAHPVCSRLGDHLEAALRAQQVAHVRGGTYLVIEGPQFSSRAESLLYRQWGCDVIGMTNLPEAKLAREAEIAYATMAMITDYDCWNEDEAHVTVDIVLANLNRNAATARAILAGVLPLIPPAPKWPCHDALQTAIMTPRELWPKKTARDLEPLLRKYLK
jgi:5'-methylthioadenosine phosphorylase